jgi:hypothetical protein
MKVWLPVDKKLKTDNASREITARMENTIAQLSLPPEINVIKNAANKGMMIRNGRIILTTS